MHKKIGHNIKDLRTGEKYKITAHCNTTKSFACWDKDKQIKWINAEIVENHFVRLIPEEPPKMEKADFVTREGRKILKRGIAWAKANGFEIVNVDTDSFSFTTGKKTERKCGCGQTDEQWVKHSDYCPLYGGK